MKAIGDICELHDKEYEVFCGECKNNDQPLCSMCVCEHYQKEHKIKINHMEGRIIDKIKELEAGILELNKKQKSIVEYTSKAETATREKDKIKDEIETKIGKAKEFWQKQNEVVFLMHEAIV